MAKNWIKRLYWVVYNKVWTPFTSDPFLYIGIPCLLVIQGLKPAIKSETLLSKGLMVDLAWVFLHALFVATFVFLFIDYLNDALDPWTSRIRMNLLGELPLWAEIIIGYMAIELLGWFSHMLRHKIRVLWVFHEVHHSQSNMNPLTLFRVHPVDYLLSECLMFLPALFFSETLGIVLSYLVISRLHDALSHSNIRTNLGPLRYIFVTPQSHRVHHSGEEAYYDMNYGVTLCIWDRLFGTHSPSDFVYPKTGIPDKAFPEEKQAPLRKLPFILGQQLIYPFKKSIATYWLGHK